MIGSTVPPPARSRAKDEAVSSAEGRVDAWFVDFVAGEGDPARVDAWVDRIARTILAEVPEVAEDAALATLMRTSVKSHWLAFLERLTAPAGEVALVMPAQEFAARLAERQIHLATLFKVYRIAQQGTWRYVTEVVPGANTPDVDDTDLLVHLWDRASAWIDASVSASVDVYQDARDRMRQGAAAERLEWIRKALDGQALDTREFSARLGGYPVSAYNTAFVLHAADNDTVAELERVASQFAGDLGSRQPLVVAPGGRELWAWVGTRSRPELRLLERRERQLVEQGVTAYVGTPGEGLEGFAVSHREARTAERITLRAGASRPVTLFPEVELLALVSDSGEAGRRFTLRTLGPLAEPTETAQRLRETLLTLVTAGSVEEAAKALQVHKNTVRYRLAQAEESMGRSVSQAPVELALALRYHAAFLAPEPPG